MVSTPKSEVEIKREKEKKIVKHMIIKYCKGHKHSPIPCENCSRLIEYVDKKIDTCPFMETKTYCRNCHVHCYKPKMREKIKEIMKYSGPRMIFSNPIIVVDHAYQGIKHKMKKNNYGGLTCHLKLLEMI